MYTRSSRIWNVAYRIVILAILFPVFHSTAQTSASLRFDRFASEEYKITKGLSQNSINCIFQDSRGFLWFGTWDGLNRYDGRNFVTYKPARQGDEESVSNQTIHSIAEDRDGILWFATDRGLCRFDRNQQNFRFFVSIPGDSSSISCDTINEIVISKDGIIWAGTNQGLNGFDPTNEKAVRIFATENGKPLDNINCMSVDGFGNIWLGMRDGLACLNIRTRKVNDWCTTQGLNSCHITSLYTDSKGFVWAGTVNGLHKIDPENNEVVMLKVFSGVLANERGNQWITSVCEDSKGILWIGTYGNGLYLIDEKGNTLKQLQHDPGDNNSLSNNYISYIKEDTQGNMWVGTAWKGVNKFNPSAVRFEWFQHNSHKANTLNNNIVWSFCEVPGGNLWIGTDGGVNILDRKTGTFSYLTYRKDEPGSLSGNNVRSIIADHENGIWIGDLLSGITYFNPETRKTKYYKHEPGCTNCISNNSVWDIIQDRSGYIWIATMNGLNRLDPKTDSLMTFSDQSPGGGLSHNTVFHLLEDRSGNIWVSTNQGLNKIQPKTGTVVSFLHRPDCNNCLSNNVVFGLYEDSLGILWIGTMGGGLNRYDPVKKKFSCYTEENGLANNVVYDIVPDVDGLLWITTNHGISRFDPATGVFTNYDVTDGLQGFEHNLGAAFRSKNGELYFGGMNGFNVLRKLPGKDAKHISPTWITGIKIFNEVSYREMASGDTIELNYRDNFFTLFFAMLDYNEAGKVQYEYLLENIDKRWRRTDAQKAYAEYTNIAPGKYTFRLRSILPFPGVSPQEIKITVIIHPPWYATWLFRSLAAVVILLTLTLIIRSRILRIRRKHAMAQTMLDMEKRLFDTERKALRLQMNPHFIFNTLNAIQYFIFQNDKLSANRYISMFSKLMRQILVNSQYNTILLKDDLDALELYIELELLRFGDKFEYRVTVSPDESILEKYIPSMILQPYVENAIRHGLIYREEKGLLKIIISDAGDGRIICTIEDNGVGRAKAEEIRQRTKPEHVSMGTKITESRLRIMNNLYKSDMSIVITDLKNEQGEATGTRIELIIPTFEK